MSSLKMTFSLTSLILILALSFAVMPAMAATGGPTVTITEYSGAEDPNVAPHATTNAPHKQERADFRLLVTFNARVETDLADADFTVRVAGAIGEAAETTSPSGIGTITAITRGANAGKSFMVPVNLTTTASTSHTADAYSFGYISFVVNADVVLGTQAGHSTLGIGNVASAAFEVTTRLPKANDWTITASLGTDKPEIKDNKFTVPASGADPNTFTVLLTRSGGTGALPEITTLDQVQIKDKDGEDVSFSAAPVPTTAGLVTTLTFTISDGNTAVATPIFVGMNPNWANAVPTGGLRIPAEGEPSKDTVEPTVDISRVGPINDRAKTFEVKFTFEEADVTGMANKEAGDVPDELMANQITLQKVDPADADAMVDSEAYVQGDIITARSGVFLATVNYRLDALPVYVGTDVTVSTTTISGMDLAADADPLLKVGDADDAMDDMVPSAPTSVTATADQATKMITVSWGVPDEVGSGITGYTITQTGAADATLMAGATDTSVMTSALAVGTYMFTVMATNSEGNGPASTSASATIDPPAPATNAAPEVDAFWYRTKPAYNLVRFRIRFTEPMSKDPNSVSRLEPRDFRIWDHAGNPITGATVSDAIVTNIPATTTGGTAYMEEYDLTVPLTGIPDARPLVVGTQLQVYAELLPIGVGDQFGKSVEQPPGRTSRLRTTYDRIPPAVVSHTSRAVTNPTGLPPGEYVRFTFVFDEPVATWTFGPDSVDQGSSHNVGEISRTHFNLREVTGTSAHDYTLLVPILDTDDDTTIVLKVGNNALQDWHLNGLEVRYIAEHTATDNTPPVFIPTPVTAWTWCEAETKTAAILLPKARDEEGDDLTYKLLDAAGNDALPIAPVPNGLYWITIDTETRHLLGEAKLSDAGTYTWQVMDEHGATATVTLTFTVTEYAAPMAVTNVMAMKVDSTAMSGADVDKVKLTWTDPNPTDYPNSGCIPAVTSYEIIRQELNSHSQGRTNKGAAVTIERTVAQVTTTTTGNNREYVTDRLPHGTYRFTVQAVNEVTRPDNTVFRGVSDPTDPSDSDNTIGRATWNKTDGPWVIVDDPLQWNPRFSANLRANQTEQPAHSATLDWNPPIANPDAPVDDAANAMALYGVNTTFGGYHLEVTNQRTAVVTNYPGDGSLIPGSKRTYHLAGLTPGEYSVRVVAHNVVGESRLSNITDFEIDVHQSPDPRDPPPSTAHLTASHANGVTTLSGMLSSNGFATVGADDLPNIQRFFAEGGSISVLSSKTGAVLRDVVISEIMWGLDLNQVGNNRANQQFIELYNTTNAAVNLSMVTIEFSSAHAVPAVASGKTLLDQVSNVSGAGWLISAAPGSSGRIPIAANAGSADLVSMYRNIAYAKVEKTDHDADAAKNRAAQLKDFPDGNALGSWMASNAADTYGLNLVGSPRAKHFVAYTPPTASSVDRSLVIINEIGNHGGDTYDWVELRNVSSGEINLKKWELSQVTSDKKDTQLVSFPDNDNHKIPAGGILLLVNSDPYRDTSHPLAAGVRINGGAEKTGLTARYYVDGGLKLADSGDTLLILRNANDKEGKAEAFKDVVGTLSITDDSSGLRTKMWPLAISGAPHGNVIDNDKDNKSDDFRSGRVYRRADAAGGTGEKDWSIVGYTGVGYKRSAANSGQNGGTPGYANDAVKVKESDLSDASVTISEIMYVKGRNLPQWIELYNSSMTQAVNISEWKLRIDNLRSDEDIDIRSPSVTTNNLGGGVTIQPNQTVLIVSGKTRRDSRSAQAGVDFPDTRVIDLWGQKDRIEVDRGETNLSYQLLSEEAFSLTLLDKDGAIVDTFGNLDTDRETILWKLPMMTEADEGRSSIIRRYDNGTERDGTMKKAWILASETNLAEVRFQDTYYGSSTDIGTPGYRGGGPLPVSLSKFRPERLESGEIVVRWITESELNNAGFNILRSEKRDGEFTKINTSLIAGQGTTSEQTTYDWKDTSAKPNVVYYYQIQDVSLDGKVQTLRQSRLKGDISPAGKATTTWGELKALQ